MAFCYGSPVKLIQCNREGKEPVLDWPAGMNSILFPLLPKSISLHFKIASSFSPSFHCSHYSLLHIARILVLVTGHLPKYGEKHLLTHGIWKSSEVTLVFPSVHFPTCLCPLWTQMMNPQGGQEIKKITTITKLLEEIQHSSSL